MEQAIDYYEQALTISREIGDRRGEGNRLGNLGNAYADLGRVEKAIDYLEQARTIFAEIKAAPLVTQAESILASLRTEDDE